MQKLIQGIHRFQQESFRPLQSLFEQLSKGQNPETLFITCSDSRIDPNLLTRSKPGDLFILRNAGNIVPPQGAACGGEAATIEFALAALAVKDIIICGHSLCGAMEGLLQPEKLASLPRAGRTGGERDILNVPVAPVREGMAVGAAIGAARGLVCGGGAVP